ncbi:MAG: cobalt ECF transporter T component CbiQ [Spirochaetaceae bacterium]|jgi:cobalt/nickel transport system permease protein|nr:cobalt ECF transporter T component CbiQ [Spirochaetaceae bacterium]
MLRKIGELSSLEQLSAGKSLLHRLHPGAKMTATLFFLGTVISFDRYSFGRLLPFLFYPSITLAVAGIPPGLLLKRSALALPFCLFAGLSNLFLEGGTALTVAGIPLSYGLISLFTLILRTGLCVLAVLILAAVTPFTQISGQLRACYVPPVFITLLEILYRYIPVLLSEGASMVLAYTLRSGRTRGLRMSHMGSFVGFLFLRSADRAERVYAAMKCRGYSLRFPPKHPRPLCLRDGIFLALVCGGSVLFRMVDIPLFLGSGLGRLLSF